MLQTQSKQDLNKWGNICLWITIFNIVNVNSHQNELQIQCNPNQNPSRLFSFFLPNLRNTF